MKKACAIQIIIHMGEFSLLYKLAQAFKRQLVALFATFIKYGIKVALPTMGCAYLLVYLIFWLPLSKRFKDRAFDVSKFILDKVPITFLECQELRQRLKLYRKKHTQQPKKVLRGSSVGCRGLQNLGNTCYLNSALQCLHKTNQIYDSFQQTQIGNDRQYKPAFETLFFQMNKSKEEPFTPSLVKKLLGEYHPLFQGYSQRDSFEALGAMLRMIYEDMNEVKVRGKHVIDEELRKDQKKSEQLWMETKKKDFAREKSALQDILYGRFQTIYQCNECKQKYILFEKFHAICLPIPQQKTFSQYAAPFPKNSSRSNKYSEYTERLIQPVKAPTLVDSFAEFCAVQDLTGVSMMTCSNCDRETQGTKRMNIYETNCILILSLKRFDQNIKISTEMEVPFELDSGLMQKCGNREEGCSYSLYGLIMHYGSSKNSGHYIAFCHDQNNGWIQYNDCQIGPVSKEIVEREARKAYVLFYRKNE